MILTGIEPFARTWTRPHLKRKAHGHAGSYNMGRQVMVMLRSATLSDLERVASWIESAKDCELWAGWRVRYPIDVSSLPDALEFATSQAFALCDEGRDLVAFGQLVRKTARRGHLARLIVDPARRGKGHGEELARSLIDRARQEGFERISLNVDVTNEAAISLYLKVGFADAARPVDEPETSSARYMEMPS